MSTHVGFGGTLLNHTDWKAMEVTIFSQAGRVYTGTVLTVNIKESSERKRHNFKATYIGEGHFKIQGEGASLRNGQKVPDSEAYPFSMDPFFNNGLKMYITEIVAGYAKKTEQHNGEIIMKAATFPKPEAVKPIVSEIKPKVAESVSGAMLLRVKTNRIKRFEIQPRVYFDTDELRTLAASLRGEGQMQPLLVIPIKDDPTYDWELVDGERRLRAAQLAGIQEVDVIVTTAETVAKQHLKSVILNLHRSGHTVMEISNALHYQVNVVGMRVSDVARAFGRTRQQVYYYLDLQKLHPDLQKLLCPPTPREEQLRIQVAQCLERIPQEKQLEVYATLKEIKNPRLQLLKARELSAPFTGVSIYARKAKPIDAVRQLNTLVERLKAGSAQIELFPTSSLVSLVTHHRDKVPDIITVLRETSSILASFAERIGEVHKALAK